MYESLKTTPNNAKPFIMKPKSFGALSNLNSFTLFYHSKCNTI
jgi:hypothetical protein